MLGTTPVRGFGAIPEVFEPWMADLRTQVRAEAGAGAEEAVKPWVMATLAASGVALMLGIIALAKR